MCTHMYTKVHTHIVCIIMYLHIYNHNACTYLCVCNYCEYTHIYIYIYIYCRYPGLLYPGLKGGSSETFEPPLPRPLVEELSSMDRIYFSLSDSFLEERNFGSGKVSTKFDITVLYFIYNVCCR